MLRDGNTAMCIQQLPSHCSNEKIFLEELLKGRSTRQAIAAIPFRSMYEQSYSSCVWNQMASKRLKRFGSRSVVEGDLVLLRTEGGGTLGKKRQLVRHVSLDDVQRNLFDMTDVVLPMVGCATELPLW